MTKPMSPVPILKNSVQVPTQNQHSQHVQFKTEQTINNNNSGNNNGNGNINSNVNNNINSRYQTSQQGTPIPVTVNRKVSPWIFKY